MDEEKKERIEEFQGDCYNHADVFYELTDHTGEGKQWGGYRPGSGRPREYNEMTTRLKCKITVAKLANVFISILDRFSDQASKYAFACRLDGQEVKWKGKGLRKYSDADAVRSPFFIRTKDGQYDEKLFLLAFRSRQPEGVAFDCFWPGKGEVSLRWQRADEITRVMMEYGILYATRNRLPKDLQAAYDTMPDYWDNDAIAEWLSKPL